MPVGEPIFRISSFCNVSGCVGVAVGTEIVSVISTQVPSSPVLSFESGRWTAFVDGVRGDLGDAI